MLSCRHFPWFWLSGIFFFPFSSFKIFSLLNYLVYIFYYCFNEFYFTVIISCIISLLKPFFEDRQSISIQGLNNTSEHEYLLHWKKNSNNIPDANGLFKYLRSSHRRNFCCECIGEWSPILLLSFFMFFTV